MKIETIDLPQSVLDVLAFHKQQMKQFEHGQKEWYDKIAKIIEESDNDDWLTKDMYLSVARRLVYQAAKQARSEQEKEK